VNTIGKSINSSIESGFTLNEMIKVVAIIAVLAFIAVFSFHYFMIKSYNIIAKHDLHHFIQAQKDYYAAHSIYLGSSGDFIEGNLTDTFYPGKFSFSPTDGIKIEIVAGNGSTPKSPLIIESSHRRGEIIYTYDFSSGEITERKK
jgi:prepilin-type N-terminal cleavage/methylation domain-containing protein